MIIQVLGTGCAKCKALYQNAQEAAHSLGIEAEITKVEDIRQIVELGVMSTPALVVDGAVKVVGKVPSVDETKRLLA